MSFPTPLPLTASAISDPTDRQLLAEFLRSTEKLSAEAAMRTLVERHSPMVLGVCFRALGERTEAEDAAQAVFLVLWKKADRLTESSIGGWLHRTALLVCKNVIRSRRIRRTHEQRAAHMNAMTPEEIDWPAVQEVLDGELDRLPEKYRVPLILFHLEGQSIHDIAERMSVAASTVGAWLGRARELLAKRLTSRGISVGAAVLASGLSSVAEARVVPATFVGSTITAASLFGAGHLAVAGGLSSSTSALAGGCFQAVFWSPLRVAVATIDMPKN